uniref:Uncharacterized protein n=1 Tax=Arion vulgaris TaxID=1028688 RepID=A0A0B7AP36_9EUPU
MKKKTYHGNKQTNQEALGRFGMKGGLFKEIKTLANKILTNKQNLLMSLEGMIVDKQLNSVGVSFFKTNQTNQCGENFIKFK